MPEFDAIVLGAGPAGLSAALKLQRLGRSVVVVTGTRGNRRRQLETVPNVEVLAHAFSSQCLEGAGVVDRSRVGVSWWMGKEKATHPVTVVERSALDTTLLSYAKDSGLAVYTTEKSSISVSFDSGWHTKFCGEHLRSRFIMAATGRHSDFSTRQNLVPWRQFGITGEVVMDQNLPGLWTESLPDGWIWGVRGEGNQYMISLFVEPSSLVGGSKQVWSRMLGQTRMAKLMQPISKTPVSYEVTPSATSCVFKDGLILLGDAALARDPLGSQGLSVAVSDGQSAAIAIHTMLGDPSKKSLAIDFLEKRHSQAILRHKTFLSESYTDAPFETSFWTNRRIENISRPEMIFPIDIDFDCPLVRSSLWTFRECAILNGDNIEVAFSLSSEHDSVRWLAGRPVEDFLKPTNIIETPRELIARWRHLDQVPQRTAFQVLRWLISQKVLIPRYNRC